MSLQLPFIQTNGDQRSSINQIASVTNDAHGMIQSDVNAKAKRITALESQIAALGRWTSVPYSAADFTGSGSMTWTVDSSDVLNFSYRLIGKSMLVKFTITSTSTGGVADLALQIKIPAGKVGANWTFARAFVMDKSTTVKTDAIIRIEPNGTLIKILKLDGTNFSATSTNQTDAYGEVEFDTL